MSKEPRTAASPPLPGTGARIEVRGFGNSSRKKSRPPKSTTTARARNLRKNAPDCDRILWRELRNRKFANYKFRRQHPVDPYTLDFYCPALKFAIELDGSGHSYRRREQRDRVREECLIKRGLMSFASGIIRFARSLRALSKRFGWRWKSATRPIPHLRPLPLRKGEEKLDPALRRVNPMTEWNTNRLIAADKKFVWHPFTDMHDWCAADFEPLVLVEGRGAILRDSRGREYIDGNSSIWTNIHGHNHPHINAAIRAQLGRVAHTSFLRFTNPAAIELAEAIVDLFQPNSLTRVFYSDDVSTGSEVALRIADQYWRLKNSRRHEFVAFQHGYHGDTAGAAALGAAAMFQVRPTRWNFPARQVPDSKTLDQISGTETAKIAAVVIEPLIQGAAGMKLWPPGTLRAVREWCDRTGALLIVDEVMTGFGRTGKMFASEHESVLADIVVLGKGLTGGYLPLAMTLVTEEIFSLFDGPVSEGKAMAYGHSYTGNALGCAAATARV